MTTSYSPRGAAVASFLAELDSVVRREVDAVDPAGGRWELDAERIAAEVAGSLADLRSSLQRHRVALAGTDRPGPVVRERPEG